MQRDPTLAPAQSDLETLLYRILLDAGLPPPSRQFEVIVAGQRFFLDLAYPDEMVFMEGDGFGVHTLRDVFERDRSRQNRLVGAGSEGQDEQGQPGEPGYVPGNLVERQVAWLGYDATLSGDDVVVVYAEDVFDYYGTVAPEWEGFFQQLNLIRLD